MIERLREWLRKLFCQHPLSARDYRFRWYGEYADAYEECLLCGREFTA